MRKHIKNILLAVFTLSVTLVFSQKKTNDTINTGVIDVVKPYTPTISDAFKVKEVPSLNDETTQTKKDIKYNIFSFPVASTFTPAKGKAATVEKAKPIKLFDNYATLGVGSYTTILGEVYLNQAISRNESVGGYFSHHSSGGGIEGILPDDNFLDSKINANYASRLRDLSWNVEGGFQYQTYNWYGLPENYANNEGFINTLDVGHSFLNAHLGADITFEDTYINSGSVLFRHFADNMGSAENRFVFKGKVDVPINDYEISTDVIIDFLGGGFDKGYNTTEELNYGNFQVGISPTYQIIEDDLTLNLGASLFYMRDNEANANKIFIYPNVTATYRLVDDVLIAYGGLQGDLIQNSYHGFASENPFVSPTLSIVPTNQIFNTYVGLKGKVTGNVSYNLNARLLADRNKAMFINNVTSIDMLNGEDYQYGNSFGVVYDDVRSLAVSGEINVDVNRNFKLSLKGETFKYKPENQAEAWNLPNFKGSLFLDYQISEKWFTGANLFYVGERKDVMSIDDGITVTSTIVNLDSYFDANLHVGYHVNNQLSIFAKGNNVGNKAYQKWQNFPVQAAQFLAGATYKFDF
ncbi:TonB-dependent receptor [Mariniflexile gromovii]|uniref:TonB-dependent receptor n=1 Tax=Mariniflexile gromovii TaxID=362523 RepID=A0ABS4BSS0_9FLAO|nr:TonB-dependent receptor [Mariniflexile gromovii]MBP0903647.1 TonB-dependent receptor [Mariniflexile gromovii]